MKKKYILYGLVFVICISISNVSSAQATNVQDSLALVDLYNSTNGPDWTNNTNWLSVPVASWYGITVADSRVTRIDLTNNNLIGTIPSSLGNLANLGSLGLGYNQLSGNIPPELGNLTGLYNLHLNNNQLSGAIPSSLGGPYYYSLRLNNNQLSGNIPPELSHSYGYDSYYDLSNNLLSGSIPPELGNLSVGWLYLSNNQLSGSIPPEFGNVSGTEYGPSVDLSNNQLSGSIPPELSKIGINSMYGGGNLNLSYNALSGSIPPEFGNTQYIGGFGVNLSHNRFTFDGMELIAEKLQGTQYDHQKRISLNLNNNVLSVSAGGTLSNNTYHWYGVRKNGHARAVITGDSVFHPTKSGIYYVRVFNAVADNLTLRTDTFYYRVPSVNTISVNELQANDGKSSFIVYPNPAKDIVHIQTNSNASFSLVNQAGKVLLTKNINGSGIMNVKSIAAGLYYLKNNTTGYTRKIIKIQ